MKTFPCPFCNEKYHRDNLVKHIEKNHDEEVPHDMTPYRLVYDIVNDHPDHKGHCSICGKDTKWNEKRQKYERLCGDPKCYEAVKQTYASRMMKVYNKLYLTDDPKHQEKMLAGRRISAQYKWSDGKMFTYTGSYEKQLLEFLDKTMEYESNEIITPGPVLEYEYKGQKHHWITDCIILPYNLIIEVKDGGDNPNNRFMPEYRAKQVAKEKMITNMGTYHYLRLTNNNFGQLLSTIAELKMNVVEDKDTKIYRINESLSIEDNNYVDLLNFCLEDARTWFDVYMNIGSNTLHEYYGILTDPKEPTHEVCSFGIISPPNNRIDKFAMTKWKNNITSLVERANDSLTHTSDYRFDGFYLDNTKPNEGYIIGINLV